MYTHNYLKEEHDIPSVKFHISNLINFTLIIKGSFRLSHQYINTFYNSYRLNVSAFIAIFRPTLQGQSISIPISNLRIGIPIVYRF
jgi:hypothetical protein